MRFSTKQARSFFVDMPRPKRQNIGDTVYHVLNRANGRLHIFKAAGDFSAFERSPADLLPSETDLKKLENCIRRGAPYGSDAWVIRTAGQLNLASTLRPRGRPKREKGS
jgi:hypothetical protein